MLPLFSNLIIVKYRAIVRTLDRDWGDWALRLGRAIANAVRLAMPTVRRLARFIA
ncbi:hypothetical protein BGM30_24280 [Microcystis aeruginosa NIES-298]|jgi:hypothetical protein|uniref:Uncharacterized protein n=1 Tax=Microcystis aeruginosa NIES-298 TaxID=449468 RepID=A0A9P3DG12_MICAE|nr:hypothetical protein BGM30_24280 [Microcystis aeruginosa NIES-298]